MAKEMRGPIEMLKATGFWGGVLLVIVGASAIVVTVAKDIVTYLAGD